MTSVIPERALLARQAALRSTIAKKAVKSIVFPAEVERPLLGGPGWRWKTCASCGIPSPTVGMDGGVCKGCGIVYGVTYGADGWAIPNYILLSQRPR